MATDMVMFVEAVLNIGFDESRFTLVAPARIM